MEASVLPLRDSEVIKQWIAQIDKNLFKGSLVGGLITLIVQSSRATVGMAILFGKQELITLADGLALLLG